MVIRLIASLKIYPQRLISKCIRKKNRINEKQALRKKENQFQFVRKKILYQKT